jgi:hypothetical protein
LCTEPSLGAGGRLRARRDFYHCDVISLCYRLHNYAPI